MTKPLLMPTLTASLVTNPRAADSPLRTSTVAAQVGGWGGDVALLGEGTKPFLVGAGSFGLGHVAYLSGFLRQHGHEGVRNATGPRAVASSWALTAPVMAVLARHRNKELGGPVFGYATMLAAMAAAASYLDADLPASARRLTAVGAGLFMVSDTLLGFRKFAMTEPAGPARDGRDGDVHRGPVPAQRGRRPGLRVATTSSELWPQGLNLYDVPGGRLDRRVGWDRRTVPPHFFPRADDPGRMSRRHVVSRPAFPRAGV